MRHVRVVWIVVVVAVHAQRLERMSGDGQGWELADEFIRNPRKRDFSSGVITIIPY